METADTWALLVHVSLDSDVAVLAPSGTPGVLDEPVVGSLVIAVSDEEHTVVEAGSAEPLHDASEVELPLKTSGVDSNGDWTLLEGLGKGLWVLGGDIGETGQLGDSTLGVASAVSASVWVGRLSVHLGAFGIGEGLVHETTIATLVALRGRAVNELLLREGLELVVLEEVGSLHGTGGGEGPA